MRRAFTLAELLIVCAILLVVASVGINRFSAYYEERYQRECISNLRILEEAKERCIFFRMNMSGVPSMDHMRNYGLLDENFTGKCPRGSNWRYSLGDYTTPSSCPNNIPDHPHSLTCDTVW